MVHGGWSQRSWQPHPRRRMCAPSRIAASGQLLQASSRHSRHRPQRGWISSSSKPWRQLAACQTPPRPALASCERTLRHASATSARDAKLSAPTAKACYWSFMPPTRQRRSTKSSSRWPPPSAAMCRSYSTTTARAGTKSRPSGRSRAAWPRTGVASAATSSLLCRASLRTMCKRFGARLPARWPSTKLTSRISGASSMPRPAASRRCVRSCESSTTALLRRCMRSSRAALQWCKASALATLQRCESNTAAMLRS
mmetsp:Transcript_48224/g.153957  ORF Transcript_48224/g.153957 Transcript_48224/m.153957 type:complete len:255 (+) Transcript_48224:342-1106(+)